MESNVENELMSGGSDSGNIIIVKKGISEVSDML